MEFDRLVGIAVHVLLEGELDVEPERSRTRFVRALVGRFHEARPATSDDRISRLAEQARGLDGRFVGGLSRLDPRRTENGYRLAEFRERVESFHELAHDTQHPPRIAAVKRHARDGRARQQSLIFRAMSDHFVIFLAIRH